VYRYASETALGNMARPGSIASLAPAERAGALLWLWTASARASGARAAEVAVEQAGEGEPVESGTIITTTANDLLRLVRDRMPPILAPEDDTAWLDPTTPAQQLLALLRPYPAETMEAVPVESCVSNPRNEGPGCLAS
jgi:putative SOS response-associated peptidase YedK